MKNFKLIIFICMLSSLFGQPAFSETVELKSGKKITGTVIEKTADSVKFQVGGGTIKIQNDDIVNLEEGESHSATVISVPVTSRFTPKSAHGSFVNTAKKRSVQKSIPAVHPVQPAAVKADHPVENEGTSVKIIPNQRKRDLPQSPVSLSPEQKKKLTEITIRMLTSLGIKVKNPEVLERAIQEVPLKVRMVLERIQKNGNEFLITLLLLLAFSFLFSVLVLTISIKLAGGNVSYLKALAFESQWIGARTLFIVCVIAVPFVIEFLFSFLIGSIGADAAILSMVASIVKVVLIVSSPLLLLALFINFASKNLVLNTGQVVAVIVISIFLKCIFAVIVWVGLGPSVLDFVKTYFS